MKTIRASAVLSLRGIFGWAHDAAPLHGILRGLARAPGRLSEICLASGGVGLTRGALERLSEAARERNAARFRVEYGKGSLALEKVGPADFSSLSIHCGKRA